MNSVNLLVLTSNGVESHDTEVTLKEIGLEDVCLYQTNLFVLTCFEWRLKNDAVTTR